MKADAYEQCQLLLAVYPAIVDALPLISTPPSSSPEDERLYLDILSLDNLKTELRDEIKKIGINFKLEDAQRYFTIQDVDSERRDDSLDDALNALDLILHLFESLVGETILHDNNVKVGPQASKNATFPNSAC